MNRSSSGAVASPRKVRKLPVSANFTTPQQRIDQNLDRDSAEDAYFKSLVPAFGSSRRGVEPAKEEQRNRAIAKHPETTFIGAHFGNNPEDLETVGKWLDKYPNFHVDIDARISELGRQPYSCRRLFIKYQDRIMFGTDTTPRADAYRLYFRFLETDDEYFDTAESHHHQGFWMIYGIFLPAPVLEKIYYVNATRLLVLPPIRQ